MSRPSFSQDDIKRIVVEDDVKFIRLQFTDVFGRMKNIAITDRQLDKALNNGYMFDGSAVEGFSQVEASDLYLSPCPDTFVIFPWRPQQGRVARLICDVLTTALSPHDGCCRSVLKRVLQEAATFGFNFMVSPECEFFLFRTDEQGNPTIRPHDKAGYLDLAPVDLGENARREMCLILDDMGYDVESSHHEISGGQYEIDFKYSDPLDTADKIMTFKTVVRVVAQKHGLHASFMPKPIYGVNGSGLHISISLAKDGTDLFRDTGDKNGLSNVAYSFIAGIMEHINGITAFLNPLINSYKRLVPGYEAPMHIAWSLINRSPLIRIPTIGNDPVKIELRSPDSACNPYLALALIIAAGLDGIKRSLTPPDPVAENLFNMSEEELLKKGIRALPRDLYAAIGLMKESKLVRAVLGKRIVNKFFTAKLAECDEYRTQVHAWELNRYLEDI